MKKLVIAVSALSCALAAVAADAKDPKKDPRRNYSSDGWMLVKEIVANVDESRSTIEYHWGKDLSGTIGGAGGVGGLLYVKINGVIYVPWYDAYGNIMGYWDAEGHVVAEYTYDAFGKLIASSGPMADVISLRYSTKYFDPETLRPEVNLDSRTKSEV